MLYAGIFALAACAGAALFWVAFSTSELGSIDTTLQAQKGFLAATIPHNPNEHFSDSDLLPSQNPLGIAISAMLLDDAGHDLDDSGAGPTATDLGPLVGEVNRSGPLLVTRQIGTEPQRLLAQRIDIGRGRIATLVVTRTLVEFRNTQSLAALLLIVTVAALVGGASISGYWLAGRVLRPVRMMTETAQDLSERDLHRRIELDLPADELGDLATTLNGMLARLEAAFGSLHRFTADAAHELRAPLALMRTEVEVALRAGGDGGDPRPVLETVLAEVDRLGRTADQLLLLARADAGVLEPHREEVDVTDLVEETAVRWHSTAREQGIALTTAIPEKAGTLTADGGMLRRLLDNLLDNAVRHTPPSGTIALTGRRVEGAWEFTVTDTGPGIDPALRPRVFERFTRGHCPGSGYGRRGSWALALRCDRRPPRRVPGTRRGASRHSVGTPTPRGSVGRRSGDLTTCRCSAAPGTIDRPQVRATSSSRPRMSPHLKPAKHVQ